RDDRVIPKDVNRGRLGGELTGHKAEFYVWAHAVCEKAVVNLVEVREVVDRIAGSVFVVDADFVVEDCVKANVFEISSLLHFFEIAEIGLAKREAGAA